MALKVKDGVEQGNGSRKEKFILQPYHQGIQLPLTHTQEPAVMTQLYPDDGDKRKEHFKEFSHQKVQLIFKMKM